eukprot:TRINITY_DN66651_c1_g1_i2.p1 TRINITY_DN66651_c1_g1~~TRINITY_DN66651_c1_g1_i2.p1  ORF type:complete len:842 (+),score=90.96 TRINITY_DN66651_c1_g1_i2:42-2528(+)
MPSPISGLWRSEDMVLMQLHMQREAAHDTILSLGHSGLVEFKDLNTDVSAFQRLFTNDVRRCEETERRLRYFEDQLRRSRMPINLEVPVQNENLDTLEPRLESLEQELRELNGKYEQLLDQQNSSLEFKAVLEQPPGFFRGDTGEQQQLGVRETTGLLETGRSGALRYICGVIEQDKYNLFDRLVYRATRGNMFIRATPCETPFEDPFTGKQQEKAVFVVFFSAQRVYDKIVKLCESLQASTYPYNIDNPREVQQMQSKVNDTITNLERTITATKAVRAELHNNIARNIYAWKRTVMTEKSCFNILNQLSYKGSTVVGECWAPKDGIDTIRQALTEADRASKAQVRSFLEVIDTDAIPPTYFRTNKYTEGFQDIVDSYGMARYKEVNPGVLTVVSFPFLFGVMYGDVGHGIFITLFALALIFAEAKLQAQKLNEIFEMIFGGRYLLLGMGIFAIWMGFLYNDMFGLVLNFGSAPYWYFPTDAQDAMAKCDDGYVRWHGVTADHTQACKLKGGSVYGFGIDPMWADTEGKLTFLNGLKMKMAVILGVMQMMVGEVLQLFNHVYFFDWKHILFQFVPEVIFLMFTFGYMDLLILIKWTTNWTAEMANNHTPPLILDTMTKFFLGVGAVEEGQYLYANEKTQQTVQMILLFTAVLSIPVILVPIPLAEFWSRKNRRNFEPIRGPRDQEDPNALEEEDTDFSEVVIKQIIHTIEYVLGCVSNTASYLRLWALSLAHAELSEVFLKYAWFRPLFVDPGIGIVAWGGWSAWFAFTLGVLLLMESLSAFLHALRLHWVEFQNKFYHGDGRKFTPYALREILPNPMQMKALVSGEE